MDTIYSNFLTGAWSPIVTVSLFLFVIVLMVAYPLSRYMKILTLCLTMGAGVIIGMILASVELLPSARVIHLMTIVAVVVMTFMDMFAASAVPSRTAERIGTVMTGVMGLSYGMTVSTGVLKGEIWLAMPSYTVGIICGCFVLAIIVCVIARILELFSMPRRDVVMLTGAVVLGMYAHDVWSFLCKLFS